MSERYDRIAAAHYAAYRPPLHQLILRDVFSPEEFFSVGLDVGCGTGYSAVALAAYCARVYGVDPSRSMLAEATAHERVVYLAGTAERLPLPRRSVDIVTLGGSLHYADTMATSEGIRSVCRRDATVITYDFHVLLEPVLKRLGLDSQANESDYDHRANFSGVYGFSELELGSQRLRLRVSAPELAHILLSDSYGLDRFVARYNASDVFPALVTELRTACDDVSVEADLYYARYRIVESE